MKLPYEKKFNTLPLDIDLKILVDYFNLELAQEKSNQFDNSSFEYMGLYMVEGYERIYWRVEGTELYAVAKPFDGEYIIEMEVFPDNAVKIDLL